MIEPPKWIKMVSLRSALSCWWHLEEFLSTILDHVGSYLHYWSFVYWKCVYIYTATCIHHQHPGIWYNTPLWSMICVCYATCIQHIFQSFFFIHPLILHALVHQARICLVNLGYNFVIAMQNPLPTLTWPVLWLKVHYITHVTLPSMSSSVRITTFCCALRATTQCFLRFGAVWGTENQRGCNGQYIAKSEKCWAVELKPLGGMWLVVEPPISKNTS